MRQETSELESIRLEDSVLSGRVRLARNLRDEVFCGRMRDEDRTRLLTRVRAAIEDPSFVREAGTLSFVALDGLDADKKSRLLEKHLISPRLFALSAGTAVAVGQDERIAVMVGEEDHLRIQAFSPDGDVYAAHALARKVDRAFDAVLPVAFDAERGFLTACPTNLGTGLRASMMLFLPVLSGRKTFAGMCRELAARGYALRGFYGEGTKGQGGLYQLSNQVTLGLKEEEILDGLETQVRDLVRREYQAFESLEAEERLRLENRVRKSYGMAERALALSLEEGVSLARDLRLARRFESNLVLSRDIEDYNRIVVRMQPAHLAGPTDTSRLEREQRRAALFRETLLHT